jgi:hypothetical protein
MPVMGPPGLARDRLEPAAHLLMDHGVQTMLYAEPIYGAYGLIVNPPGVSKCPGSSSAVRAIGALLVPPIGRSGAAVMDQSSMRYPSGSSTYA